MSEEPTQEQMVEAVYAFAAEQMQNGLSARQVEQKLVEEGLDEESARIVVENIGEARANVMAEAGRKNMLHGALWCIGGTVVTAVTYSAASTGGGSYVVAWGAILFGGVQFFQGVIQTVRGR